MKEQNFWDKIAKEYAIGRTKGREYVLDPELFRITGEVQGKKVLDVACGSGELAIPLAQKGAICTGVDSSKEMIRLGIEKAKHLQVDIKFIVADARKLPLTQNDYDLAVIALLFPHLSAIEDMHQVVRNLSRLVRPNGRLIIGEPHPAFDYYMRKRLKDGSFEYFHQGLPYEFTMDIAGQNLTSTAWHWTLENYVTAITNNGFSLEQIVEPKPLLQSQEIDPEWFEEKMKYPAYIIFDCLRKAS